MLDVLHENLLIANLVLRETTLPPCFFLLALPAFRNPPWICAPTMPAEVALDQPPTDRESSVTHGQHPHIGNVFRHDQDGIDSEKMMAHRIPEGAAQQRDVFLRGWKRTPTAGERRLSYLNPAYATGVPVAQQRPTHRRKRISPQQVEAAYCSMEKRGRPGRRPLYCAEAGTGTTPSCCINPHWSRFSQTSWILPSATLIVAVAVQLTRLPVAGTPNSSP